MINNMIVTLGINIALVTSFVIARELGAITATTRLFEVLLG